MPASSNESSGLAQTEETSQVYLGQWQQLVSTTNWEKGRIIHEWRQSLTAVGASPQECSDETWSQRVGHVSSQHVGRLRRVYERFFAAREQYAGLYWSHFQAALDFDDAEMWLEGAVQNGWSVSQMRRSRWEVLGNVPEQEPRDSDLVEAELDEDFDAVTTDELSEVRDPAMSREETTDNETSDHEVEDTADDESAPFVSNSEGDDAALAETPVRPFADLPPLPDDIQDACESFKLAILHHKLAGWEEISRDDLLATLDALKQLALAPTDDR
jgi:hypothetical protein